MTLDPATYLEHIREDGSAFLTAARQGGDPPLPAIASCPEWNMGEMLLHLGWVHRLIGYRVEHRIRNFRDLNPSNWMPAIALEGQDLAWARDNMPSDIAIPDRLYAWFEEGLSRLVTALSAASPEEAVGTWFPPNQTAGFWQRRMAHETAVHRWDAQAAVGRPDPIDPVLARDGIEEIFDTFLPLRGEDGGRPGAGESYHFHATDGEGEWLVRFEGDDATVTREHGKADVAVRGTASDLLLFLWGRVPPRDLEVLGDADLLGRYFELVPPG